MAFNYIKKLPHGFPCGSFCYVMNLRFMMDCHSAAEYPEYGSLYHESTIHGRHSPFAGCASTFFSLTLIISYLGVLLNRGCPLQPMQLAPALHVRKTLLPQRLIKHNGNGIG